MKKYMEPEMECIEFAVEDIITTSSKSELFPIDPDEGVIV